MDTIYSTIRRNTYETREDLWKYLSPEQYIRLCDCRSLKEDIEGIAKCFMLCRNKAPEDALVCTLEHLDCNSQSFELTRREYNNILWELKTIESANKTQTDDSTVKKSSVLKILDEEIENTKELSMFGNLSKQKYYNDMAQQYIIDRLNVLKAAVTKLPS